VPLAVTGIGVAGTLTAGIAGGLVTQRWSAREDENRAFEHRRQACADFHEAVKGTGQDGF
jgi:hypothetical protein